MNTKALYRVGGKAPAAVIFRAGDSLSINYVRDGVSAQLTFSTRYIESGFETRVPGSMGLSIDVETDSLGEALTFVTQGREIASIISLAANASIEPFEGEVAYDATPGKQEREFFQRFVPNDEWTFSSRLVPIEATSELVGLVAVSAHRDRLIRAITQYSVAISYLGLGNELLVVAHLWMGIEAIKTAYLRHHLDKRGISAPELAHEWGYKPRGGYLQEDSFLNSEARVRLVCQGDAVRHRTAREVSDSFEHGLKNGGKLFAPALEVLEPVAGYLREAIFDIAGLSDPSKQTLMAEPYTAMRGPGQLEQYLRATLVCDTDDFAAEGHPHPSVDWVHKIVGVDLDPIKWSYTFRPAPTLTPRIGAQATMKGLSMEIWDGGLMKPTTRIKPD